MESSTAKRIKELIGTQSQQTFADKIHTSQSNISKIINGAPPSASTLVAIAKACDVSVDWLLGLTDSKQITPPVENQTHNYGDTLALFDYLITVGALSFKIEKSPFDNEETRSESCLVIEDKILRYLLNQREAAYSLNSDIANNWINQTTKKFSVKEIINWELRNLNPFASCIDPEIKTDEQALAIKEEYLDEETLPF